METGSTRGPEDLKQQIAAVINASHRAGGNIIGPQLRPGEVPEILYYITRLLWRTPSPTCFVFLDSPWPRISSMYSRSTGDLFDQEIDQFIRQHGPRSTFPGLKITSSSDESQGHQPHQGHGHGDLRVRMCTGGRIKHHLANNISAESARSCSWVPGRRDPGRGSSWTVRRRLRILGQVYPVRPSRPDPGLLRHADKTELLAWLKGPQAAASRGLRGSMGRPRLPFTSGIT